jgi:hypothetical protein
MRQHHFSLRLQDSIYSATIVACPLWRILSTGANSLATDILFRRIQGVVEAYSDLEQRYRAIGSSVRTSTRYLITLIEHMRISYYGLLGNLVVAIQEELIIFIKPMRGFWRSCKKNCQELIDIFLDFNMTY